MQYQEIFLSLLYRGIKLCEGIFYNLFREWALPPKTFFLLRTKPIPTKNYFSFSPKVLVSRIPQQAIGFSNDLISKGNLLHFSLFLQFPTSKICSFDVLIFMYSIPLPKQTYHSIMYSQSLKLMEACLVVWEV